VWYGDLPESGAGRHGAEMQLTLRRLNDGLLQPLERPVLRWLVSRIPSRVTPDQLTLIGLVGSVIVFIGYVLCPVDAAFLWLANAGLVVNWFGDSLDGTLARFRGIERVRYGFFIDHTTDLLTQVMFAFGLGLSSYVRFEVACLALIAYLLLAVRTFIRTIVSGKMQLAFVGIGPTEVRVGMIILNLSMWLMPPKPILVLWAPLSVFDLSVLASSAITVVFFLIAIRKEARQLALEDPAPANEGRVLRQSEH
jgi:phosphatidylglycerophosphate synthase